MNLKRVNLKAKIVPRGCTYRGDINTEYRFNEVPKCSSGVKRAVRAVDVGIRIKEEGSAGGRRS